MRIRSRSSRSTPYRNMSAMIDVVFLLLVFFMLTLQIAGPEGVHEVSAQADHGPPDHIAIPPVHVGLKSAVDGSLTAVSLNGRALGRGESGLQSLQREVQYLCEVLGPEASGKAKIIIKADYELKYEHSVRAMGICSSRRNSDGSLIPLGPQVSISTTAN